MICGSNLFLFLFFIKALSINITLFEHSSYQRGKKFCFLFFVSFLVILH